VFTLEKKIVTVPNIGCDGCVNTIKNEVGALSGVLSVDGSSDTKVVTIQWDNPATWTKIAEKMQEIDYAPAEA
jgi:copper chaperone CopZ